MSYRMLSWSERMALSVAKARALAREPDGISVDARLDRIDARLDLLLVEIMELRRLLSTAPIDPEEG